MNKTPNQPRCTLSLYRFKQEYKLEKELVPYRNLYIMLKYFKTPMSRVACEVMDEGTVVLYDFTSLFDFVREYHHAVCKGGCRECWVASDKPNNWLLRDASALQVAAKDYIYSIDLPKKKIHIVPTLQAFIIRRLMYDYNIHYHCGQFYAD